MPTDGTLTFVQTPKASIDTPLASYDRFFFDTDGFPKYKDSSGNTHVFGGVAFLNVIDYGADPTGVSDSTTAIQSAMSTATFATGQPSIIYFPQGTYLVSGVLTPASYYYAFVGAGNPQTTIISTSQSGDLFDINQWYCTIKDMLITAPATTLNQAGVTLTTTPQTLTIASITIGQWLTAGNFYVGTTAGGWQLASYTGRTATTLTGVTVASGSIPLTTGAPIQLKTGGYAVNISNGQNYQLLDNAWITNFYQAVNQAGSTNSMRNLQIRNTVSVGINVNNTNAQVYLHNVTMDNTTTNQPTVNLQVLVCGLLQITDSDFIHGGTNMLINSTGVGCFSIYVTNTFFDTCSTAGLSIQGTTTVRSVKFVCCWFSSSTLNGIVLNNASASGIDFIGCDIYNNAGTAVVQTSVGDVAFQNCRISSPSAGTLTGMTLAGAPTTTNISVQNCTIGAVGAFFSFATGISIAAGTYGSIKIIGNHLSGNTTHITDSTTTGMNKIIANNTGLVFAPTTNVTATAIPLTTITNVDSRGGVPVPANVRPSTTIRVTVYATNAATVQTLTATLRYGTANTNADAAVLTQAFTAGTLVAGSGVFEFEATILTSTTLGASVKFVNGNNAATGIAGNISLFAALATPATISTAAANFLGVYFSSATAAAITIRQVSYEILGQ